MRLRRLVAIASGIGLAVAALGLAELVCRVVDPITPSELSGLQGRDFQLWTQGPCYRVEGSRLIRVPPPKSYDLHTAEVERDFSLVKPPGVRRIAVVGESTGEMLERAMAALVEQPGCKDQIEVLRCSATGSRPETAVRRAEEVLAYSPDAIVVAIGHNFMLTGPPTKIQVQEERSRLVHEIRRLLPPELPPPPKPGTNELTVDPSTIGTESYEKITSSAKAHGVQVVALLLSSNLWFPPDSEPGYLDSRERATAWVKWARGDVAGAIAALSPVNGADGAMRAYERAFFRSQADDWGPVRHDLGMARDLDLHPTRAATATTNAIAMAARQGGATLLDADALFAQLADHQLPGWDVFFDNCHPYATPLDILARMTIRTAAPKESFACLPHSDAHPKPTDAEAYQQFIDGPYSLRVPASLDTSSLKGDPRRSVAAAVVTLLHSSPREAQSLLQRFDSEVLSKSPPAIRAATLAAIGEVARDQSRFDVATWAVGESVRNSPMASALVDSALLHLHSHNEDAARADANRAVQLDPASGWARSVRDAIAKP